MNAPASPGTSDSGAAAGSDSEQGSGSSSETTTTYKLTLSVKDNYGGTVTPAGTTTYNAGEQVEINAIPEESMMFDGWSDGNINPKRTITMDSDKTLVANFSYS